MPDVEATAVQEIAPVAPLPQLAAQANPPRTDLALKPFDQAASQAGTKISESIAFLERIEQIEIKKVLKRNGRQTYVMEMYLHKADSDHHAPPLDAIAIHLNPLVGKKWESNYQVDHTFAQFAELRRMLQYISHLQGGKAHTKQCKYCKEMLGFVEHSLWQPGFWTRLLTTQKMRKELLTKFMRKIVELAVSSKSCEKWSCEAFYHVPLLVEKFLRKPEDTSTGII